jgi:hypothetical protein
LVSRLTKAIVIVALVIILAVTIFATASFLLTTRGISNIGILITMSIALVIIGVISYLLRKVIKLRTGPKETGPIPDNMELWRGTAYNVLNNSWGNRYILEFQLTNEQLKDSKGAPLKITVKMEGRRNKGFTIINDQSYRVLEGKLKDNGFWVDAEKVQNEVTGVITEV